MPRLAASTMGLLFSVWLLVSGWGFAHLLNYKATPGSHGLPPSRWPEGTGLDLAAKGKTLVMFAHPKCGCTRASFQELATLMAKCQGPLTVTVVVVRPAGTGAKGNDNDCLQSAARMTGVHVQRDDEGRLAALFHANTSGNTVLYDEHGRLLFSGGITGSRGHAGMNAGHIAILEHLSGKESALSSAPVFGCPLFNSRTDADCQGAICTTKK